MPLAINLAEIMTWANWRALHKITQWVNSKGVTCFFARYGNYEFHVGISIEAARWQVDEGQRAFRDMFAGIIWC